MGVSVPAEGAPNLAPLTFGQVPFYNVKAAPFNAQGNLGVADDTIPIQSALNTVGKGAFRGLVFFPEGAFRVTASLILALAGGSVSNPILICGSGQGTQIINACPAATPTFLFAGVSFFEMRDVLLTGNDTNPNDGIVVKKDGGGNQCARFRFNGVTVQMPGRGFVLQDTNTGVLMYCKVWPSANSGALAVPQVVSLANISHAVHMTGAFCNDITIYDLDAQIQNGCAAGAASYKFDAAAGSAIRLYGGLCEGVGVQAADKHSVDFANIANGLFISGLYAENSNFKLSNCRDGCVDAHDNAQAGLILLTGGCVRLTLQNVYGKDLQVDAGCFDISVNDCEFFNSITDNGTRTVWKRVTLNGVRQPDKGAIPISFRYTKSSATAVGVGAGVTVLFDTQDWDDKGFYTPATGRFVAGYAGRYQIAVNGSWNAVTVNVGMSVYVYKNGIFFDSFTYGAYTGGNCPWSGILQMALAAGDYVTITAFNNDSAIRNLAAGASFMVTAI